MVDFLIPRGVRPEDCEVDLARSVPRHYLYVVNRYIGLGVAIPRARSAAQAIQLAIAPLEEGLRKRSLRRGLEPGMPGGRWW